MRCTVIIKDWTGSVMNWTVSLHDVHAPVKKTKAADYVTGGWMCLNEEQDFGGDVVTGGRICHSKGGECLLSLWRVARGSKHMFLELIHGLFIT